MSKVGQKIREAWKAVVAVLIPLAWYAAGQVVDTLGAWAQGEGAPWSAVIVALLTGAGVWLKANQPPAA